MYSFIIHLFWIIVFLFAQINKKSHLKDGIKFYTFFYLENQEVAISAVSIFKIACKNKLLWLSERKSQIYRKIQDKPSESRLILTPSKMSSSEISKITFYLIFL